MRNNIIDFKSENIQFSVEKTDEKNNTVREIDMKDERFQELMLAWKEKDYPFIRINMVGYGYSGDLASHTSGDKMYSFIRRIRNISVYKDLMIITWEKKNEENN